jgi:hypothetical protein
LSISFNSPPFYRIFHSLPQPILSQNASVFFLAFCTRSSKPQVAALAAV